MQVRVAEIPRVGERVSEGGPLRRRNGRARRPRRELTKRLLIVAADGVSLTLSHWIAAAGVQHLFQIPPSDLEPGRYVLFYLPFLLAVLFLFERGESVEARRPERELELVVKGVSLAFAVLVCANFVFFKELGFSRYLIVSWYAVALAFLLLFRFSLRAVYAQLWRRGRARYRTLLIGSPERVLKFQEALAIQRFQGYELVGTILVGDEAPCDGGLRILGPLEGWREAARDEGVEQVVLCLSSPSEREHRLIFDIVRGCVAEGIDVQIPSDLFGSREFNYEMDGFSGFFRFQPAPRWPRRFQTALKACLDSFAGLVGSLLTLLLTPFIGLAIKLEDGGPIFYRREFVDRDGKIRFYLKFRTMHAEADRILRDNPDLKAKFDEKYKLADDPRVLRVGRFLRKYSLDELPQFLSLLRGQLSLVGPRVISGEEAERYGANLAKLLSTKPGLTGFWQIMGRQLTTYRERIRMDMFYIDHWSIWLDLWIIAKTFWVVIGASGAY